MTSVMIAVLVIFAVTYALIASEKIDKSAAAVLGATLVVLFHLAPLGELFHKVDLNVIFLLAGMMMIVNILAQTGIFEWVAITLAQRSGGRGMVILVKFLIATAILSALLDNVTTVILMAPITILVTQILEVPTVPVLILEAVFSNIGGTATLVGDPPNIVIGSQGGLTFNDFLVNLSPVVALIMVVSLLIVYPLFAKYFYVPENIRQRVMRAYPQKAIINPRVLRRALPVFGLVLVGFFLGHSLHIEPGIIALAGALLMAIVCRVNVHHALEKVEWGTIFFFIGLFMLIGALEVVGLFELLGQQVLELTRGNLLLTAMVILWSCAIFSAIVDNIPLVIAMMPLLKTIIPGFAAQMGLTDPELINTQIAEPLYWALALGACLGGNGSLIGASANVVVAQIALRNKYKLSFWQFTKYGFPLMVVSLIISTGYIYLRYFM